MKCEVETLKKEIVTKDENKNEFLELQKQLQELNQHIQDKNAEIIHLKDEKDTKEREIIESLTAELEILKRDIIVKDDATETLQLDLELLKQELLVKNEAAAALVNSVETLKAELLQLQAIKAQDEEHNLEIEKLRHNLDELNQEIHDRNAEIFRVRDEKDIKNAENLELQEALEQSKAREAQSEAVTNKLSDLSSQIQLMESTNEDLTRKLIESNDSNSIANAKINEISNLESKLKVLDAQSIKFQSSILFQTEKIEQLENQILDLTKSLETKTAECDDLKSRYKRRSSDTEKKLSVMEIRLNDIIQENGALGYENMSLENEVKKLKNELHFIQDRSPTQTNEIARLQHYIHQMDHDLAVVSEKLTLITGKFDEAVLENKELTEKLSALSKTCEQQSAGECAKLQREIDVLTAKVKLLTSENFVHSNKVTKLQECNNDLTHQLQEMKNMHIFKNKQQVAELDAGKQKILEFENNLKMK